MSAGNKISFIGFSAPDGSWALGGVVLIKLLLTFLCASVIIVKKIQETGELVHMLCPLIILPLYRTNMVVCLVQALGCGFLFVHGSVKVSRCGLDIGHFYPGSGS